MGYMRGVYLEDLDVYARNATHTSSVGNSTSKTLWCDHISDLLVSLLKVPEHGPQRKYIVFSLNKKGIIRYLDRVLLYYYCSSICQASLSPTGCM